MRIRLILFLYILNISQINALIKKNEVQIKSLESLNDAMDYIKSYPDQISYLMEEWKVENQDLIAQFG